jgi:hypothetical protein
VTAVQNHAAQTSYENLPDSITNSYRYVAIRDARTSAICRALDGNVYRYDDPKRRLPPQHINCRSGTQAVILDANGKEIPLSKIPNTFASYAEWLKQQTKTQQDSILGPTRAQWWRTGKMSLADAVDADNRILTLDQLRKRLGFLVGATG